MDLSKITKLITALYLNLTAILFLVGITLINIAIFMQFNTPTGLISTGISLMVIAWLLNYESEKYAKRRCK